MNKVSEAQKRATAKYEKEKYDKVLVRLPKGTKAKIQSVSDSVNGYITQAIEEKMNREASEDITDALQEREEIPDKQSESNSWDDEELPEFMRE